MSLASTMGVSTTDPTTSTTMLISDGDSSALVEAMVALKEGRPSLPARKALPTAVKIADTRRVDSGYASANTSESPTPDSFKDAFVDGGAVVNKARVPWPIPSRKKIKLMPFDKPIPTLTQNRFQDLRELHANNLNKLTSGLARCRGILMSLKVLGESETTAAPWVFIQCDRAIAGKVRRFFKQAVVQSDFKPSHPNAYAPSFEIYILELPPVALGKNIPSSLSLGIHDNEKVEVYCQKTAISSLGSLCGSKITVSAHGEVRSATIGGLIFARSNAGTFPILGLTAGHFLAEQHFEYSSDEDDDLDEGFSSDDDRFELDTSSFNSAAAETLEKDETHTEMLEKSQSIIGHVYQTSQDDLRDQPNLDWALFTIEDTSLYLPNVITEHEITRLKHPTSTKEDRKVVLTTAMSGPASGILSRSFSYLMLAPGKSLVRTNALSISDKKVLKPGDSGAWVVDEITSEVYGHVVASDVFGVSYVVPISDIFEDIKIRLSLEAVDLLVGCAKPESKISIRTPRSVSTRDLASIHADPLLKELRQVLDHHDTAVGPPSPHPLPVDQVNPVSQTDQTPSNSGVGIESVASSRLPPGWEARKTMEGRRYYVCYATKQTTWERPKTPEVTQSSKQESQRKRHSSMHVTVTQTPMVAIPATSSEGVITEVPWSNEVVEFLSTEIPIIAEEKHAAKLAALKKKQRNKTMKKIGTSLLKGFVSRAVPSPSTEVTMAAEVPEPSGHLQLSTPSSETHPQEVLSKDGDWQPLFDRYGPPTTSRQNEHGYQSIGMHHTTAYDPKTLIPLSRPAAYAKTPGSEDSGYVTMEGSPANSPPLRLSQ